MKENVSLWIGGACLLAGACFANASLFAAIAPFGAAYTAAVPKKYLTIATAGAVLGYALSTAVAGNLKYIAALLLVFALRKLWPEKGSMFARAVKAAGIAAGATLLPSGILAIYVGLSPYLAVLTLAEGCLAGTMAFFLQRTLETLRIRRSLGLLRPVETAALLLCFGVLSMGLADVSIFGYGIGRVLIGLLLLIMAQLGREGGGAVYGLCAGVALSMRDTALLYYVVGWGFGALLSGVFAAVGRLGAVVSILLTGAFSALFAPDGIAKFSIFYELLGSCALFLCIPPKLLERLRPYVARYGTEPDGLAAATVFRLRYAGESLRQIGEAVNTVSKRLPVTGDDEAALVDEVSAEVCAGCEKKSVCWGERFEATNAAFRKLMELLRNDPSPPLASYPETLLRECRHPKVVAAALAQRVQAMQRQIGAKRRLMAVQSVVAEQFGGLGGLLGELAGRFARVESYDARATAALTEYLNKRGAAARAALVCEDPNGRCRAELCVDLHTANRLDIPALAEAVSRICEVNMELCDISETDSHQRLLFLQEAVYKLDFGVCQIPKDGRLCGDSYDHFTGEDGSGYLLLSDGMGAGGRAAVDSAMTCSLLGRLLSAGFPFDAAMQLVNSAMLVKSGDESLATLDMARVCLFTGETELIKCGAAPTFLRKGGHVGAIAVSSLPIGILNGVCSEKRSLTMRGGDLLVMVSDGVSTEDSRWLKKLLELWHGPAAELAEVIASQARDMRSDGHADDITVVVGILQRN